MLRKIPDFFSTKNSYFTMQWQVTDWKDWVSFSLSVFFLFCRTLSLIVHWQQKSWMIASFQTPGTQPVTFFIINHVYLKIMCYVQGILHYRMVLRKFQFWSYEITLLLTMCNFFSLITQTVNRVEVWFFCGSFILRYLNKAHALLALILLLCWEFVSCT